MHCVKCPTESSPRQASGACCTGLGAFYAGVDTRSQLGLIQAEIFRIGLQHAAYGVHRSSIWIVAVMCCASVLLRCGRKPHTASLLSSPGTPELSCWLFGYLYGLKLRSRRLLLTTKTDENAIAAPASMGLSSPAAASGSAAML